MKLRCIDGSVDGLSEDKIYEITAIRKDKDGTVSYFLKDDYGIYSQFRADRFVIIEI